ncbi:hypothetical protein D9M70_557450 [compost metagenome]
MQRYRFQADELHGDDGGDGFGAVSDEKGDSVLPFQALGVQQARDTVALRFQL